MNALKHVRTRRHPSQRLSLNRINETRNPGTTATQAGILHEPFPEQKQKRQPYAVEKKEPEPERFTERLAYATSKLFLRSDRGVEGSTLLQVRDKLIDVVQILPKQVLLIFCRSSVQILVIDVHNVS